MKQIALTVDGKRIVAREGDSILEAALSGGVYIPHLCSHKGLFPAGACRMCMVGIARRDGVAAACSTRAEDGMVVDTHHPLAERIRRLSCDLLLKRHPSECTNCPKYGRCQLQSIMQAVGDTGRRLKAGQLTLPVDARNPILLHDMSRCILCGRCVRACRDMRGVGALRLQKVEGRLRVVVDGESLRDADCRFCSACVDVCPTGAIREQDAIAEKFTGTAVPCQKGCPAQIDIPAYIRAIRQGDSARATALVREKAMLPETLGFVCTHPCEAACKRGVLNEAVSIRNLKRFAARQSDGAWTCERLPDTGKRVAVVGAGPAGLTAAWNLARKGHDVTIYDANDLPGGAMRYGIPTFRLPREVLDREINEMLSIGIKLITNKRIEYVPDLLREEFDAAFVAVGTHRGVKLPIPGVDLGGVYTGVEFLRAIALDAPLPVGRRVLVLGGGNVAMDCAGAALRLGAESVSMACIEREGEMLASEEEIQWTLEEGLTLYAGHSFLEIRGEGGVATGVLLSNIEGLGEVRADADTVIFAVGQTPDVEEGFGIPLSQGKILAETGIPGIFAGGDCVTGTASVIEAVAAGRNAASAIDRYLGGDGDIEIELAERAPRDPILGRMPGFDALMRREADVLPPEIRSACFAAMDLGLSDAAAACEAERCLQCDLRLDIAPQRFWSDYVSRERDNRHD